MIDFLTRGAALLCSGLMAFAYWMAHGAPPSAIANQGEPAGSTASSSCSSPRAAAAQGVDGQA
jgi:hypothetical protein